MRRLILLPLHLLALLGWYRYLRRYIPPGARIESKEERARWAVPKK
jgi:hypothetical protein